MFFTIEHVVHEMGKSLQNGDGTYFLGSGVSAGSGLPDWLGLIQEIASPLGLSVTKDDDLGRIAQFCINEDNGNRGPLVGRLRRALGSHSLQPNQYHEAILRTNLCTIWTTNFDTLLEKALKQDRVAIRACDAELTNGTREFNLELLKIHGCIDRSRPDELVVTQEDYENFVTRRPALAERLRHDLLQKSFLFAGYSYRDPNIATALVEARRLAEGATREHFFITLHEKEPEAIRRQELWHADLRRFGIRTAFIQHHAELASALERLALTSRGKSVFVTGSHSNAFPLAAEVGKLLANQEDTILLDGQSTGVGREAANAFGTACVHLKHDIRDRIRYFPNPYAFNPDFSNDRTLLGTLKQYRASLARAAHTFVVFDGGMGTDAEIEVAQEMNCVIVPVMGVSGGTGSKLLNDANITSRLSSSYVKKAKGCNATAVDVVECVMESFAK